MTIEPDSNSVVPLESGRDRLRVVRGAAIALYALLSANIAFAAIAFGHELDRHSLFERAKSKPWTITLDEVRAVNDRVDALNAIFLGLVVATAIAFAVWTWAAYSRLGALGYERRYSSTWAAGGWFVPFANLFIPKRIVNDLVDAEVPRRGVTAATVTLRRWTMAWWVAWIASLAFGWVVNNMDDNVKTIDDGLNASSAFMLRSVVLAVAAVLAILAVCFVTRQQRALSSVR
jgi:hypothetical protein